MFPCVRCYTDPICVCVRSLPLELVLGGEGRRIAFVVTSNGLLCISDRDDGVHGACHVFHDGKYLGCSPHISDGIDLMSCVMHGYGEIVEGLRCLTFYNHAFTMTWVWVVWAGWAIVCANTHRLDHDVRWPSHGSGVYIHGSRLH